MNKKADITISLKTLIGFIIVAVVFMAFIGFAMKLWGIFLSKPDEGTINSFKNLVYEIKTMEDGDEPKTVPYYIGKQFMLTTDECQKVQQVKEDICVCKVSGCKSKVVLKDYAEPKVEISVSGLYIRGDTGDEIKNLELKRTGNHITVTEIT